MVDLVMMMIRNSSLQFKWYSQRITNTTHLEDGQKVLQDRSNTRTDTVHGCRWAGAVTIKATSHTFGATFGAVMLKPRVHAE